MSEGFDTFISKIFTDSELSTQTWLKSQKCQLFSNRKRRTVNQERVMVNLQILEMDLSEDQILNLPAGKKLRDVMSVHWTLTKTKLLQVIRMQHCNKHGTRLT